MPNPCRHVAVSGKVPPQAVTSRHVGRVERSGIRLRNPEAGEEPEVRYAPDDRAVRRRSENARGTSGPLRRRTYGAWRGAAATEATGSGEVRPIRSSDLRRAERAGRSDGRPVRNARVPAGIRNAGTAQIARPAVRPESAVGALSEGIRANRMLAAVCVPTLFVLRSVTENHRKRRFYLGLLGNNAYICALLRPYPSANGSDAGRGPSGAKEKRTEAEGMAKAMQDAEEQIINQIHSINF